MCRRELVADATIVDGESVVGEECHIVSAHEQGPRYDPSLRGSRLDEPGNLILLCRNHHKTIDDQCETYTVELLRTLKTNHEKWVASTLDVGNGPTPVRVRRIAGKSPSHLGRVTSGRSLMAIVDRACAFEFGHDELESEAEADLVAGFLQEAQDYGDLSDDWEAGQRVKIAFRMSEMIGDLERDGLWVFGGRETRQLEGGIGAASPFPIAILRVVHAANPDIIKLSTDSEADQVLVHTQSDQGLSDSGSTS